VAYLSAPGASAAMTAEALGARLAPPAQLVENRRVPGEWLEYSRILTVLIRLMGIRHVGKVILTNRLVAVLD
jgi:short-chain fatty acids transporter